MIKAIIFDLDNCLAPAREVGEALYQPALDAMREANHGNLPEEVLDESFEELWGHALDAVATKYGFSEEMLNAGWRIFEEMEVQETMHGYVDLEVLADLPVQRFLVTSGFRRLQSSKITALNLAPYFTEIHIDAIDEPDRLEKEGLFKLIMETHQLNPAEVIVVGDNPSSELAAGNRLGMMTVQTLRPGVKKTDLVSHHVDSLDELKEVLH